MLALQIRHVPVEVRDALARQARARGQSLQSFLLSLITAEARRSRNVVLLDELEGKLDGVEESDRSTALDEVRDAQLDDTTDAE
jgi:hypothetical protein